MASNSFMRVDDVAEELGVSTSYAYKIIRKLNVELEKKYNQGTVPMPLSQEISVKKVL